MQQIGQTEKALRSLRRERYRYSEAQVNFIRESYLLDGRDLPWLEENVAPRSSRNALWRIAVGRSYPGVPLSPRLQAALDGQKQNGAAAGAAPIHARELLAALDEGSEGEEGWS